MKKPLLELKEIHKTYYKKKKILKKAVQGVSFTIYEGEIFSLLGVNGAGKTTLSGILAGLHPPTSGDLLWKGKSIYKDILRYKRIVGLCPQKPNIDPDLTITETLTFAAQCYGKSEKESKKRVAHLMDLLDLNSYKDSIAKHLSGGYKQRFLIARSLAHSPMFLILDEPTVGLDPHIRKQLWTIIRTLKEEGVTTLLTTHYLEEAESLSDRVCFINNGEIQVLDTPENLNKHYKKENLEDVFLHLMEEKDKEDE
ncbi:MAG: Daunorubicin/doxorubicin resistance ATP-binding protein DrrA [Chlamydiae bacterium]|nr:Daunorubicin/doxorubicin resistance ATP-binding protein DrrA [Chlamydiota bacterium]